MEKQFSKKARVLFIVFTMIISFTVPSSVFASGDDSIEVRDEILNDIMNDPMVKRILKYVSQDENGFVIFDINAAKKDGQSSEVITQGNLFNEISKGYSDLGNDNYGMMARPTGIPIWGNWCGPGYGGGPTKDLLDAACKEHDLNYAKYGYFHCGSDLILIARIERDYGSMGFFEKIMAKTIQSYFIVQFGVNCT